MAVALKSEGGIFRLELFEGGLHAGTVEVGKPLRQFLGVGKRGILGKRNNGNVRLLFFRSRKKGLRQVERAEGVARSWFPEGGGGGEERH